MAADEWAVSCFSHVSDHLELIRDDIIYRKILMLAACAIVHPMFFCLGGLFNCNIKTDEIALMHPMYFFK